jgi:hypothetical protein
MTIIEHRFGPDNPNMLAAVETVAQVSLRLGRYADARDVAKQWVQIVEKMNGPDDYYLSLALAIEADALRALGELDATIPLYERAAAVAVERGRAGGTPAYRLGRMRFELATVLWDTHKDRARAVALATQARADLAHAGDAVPAPERREVADWLARHRAP